MGGHSTRIARGRWAVALAAMALAGWSLVGSACATVNISKDRELAFHQAVEAHSDHDWAVSARAAFVYADGASKDDTRYDRALRLLASDAEHLGLTYAASLWYLDIAEGKRDVELLPDAIRGLERIVMGGPHDEETLVRGFLASAEFPLLPPDVQPFIDYIQGLDSARHALNAWADKRFRRVRGRGAFAGRVRYVRAVRLLAQGHPDQARALLEELAKDDGKLPRDLSAEVHRSLARMDFDAHRYDDALAAYERVRDLAPEDPSLLLEMAWTHYYRGDSRRALGLLLALDAPVYRDLIAPERFLLEAMCLRRLCQFNPARKAAVRLRHRYGAALDEIHAGVPLMESKPLRAAARRRPDVRGVAAFVARLRWERERVEDLEGDLGDKLTAALKTLYDRGLREAKRREERELTREVKTVAEDLLEAEEGVRLILHELSVAMLRGRRRPGGREAPPVELSTGGDEVFYRFDGEFWTDELDDLVVVLEDRCVD